MSRRERWAAMLGAAFGVLLAIATPQLPREAKIVLWLVYAAVCIGFLVSQSDTLRRRGAMAFVVTALVGATLGLVAAVIAWYAFPPEELAAASVSPELPNNSPAPSGAESPESTTPAVAPAKPLPLKMHTFFMAAGNEGSGSDRRGHIQLASVTLTNTSDRNMSLRANMSLDHRNKDGSPARTMVLGEWNSPSLEQGSGDAVINVPAQSTVEARLDFYIPSPDSLNNGDWSDTWTYDATLHLHDLISGIRAEGDATSYPSSDPPRKSLAELEALWQANKDKPVTVRSFPVALSTLSEGVRARYPDESQPFYVPEGGNAYLFEDFSLKLVRKDAHRLEVLIFIEGEDNPRRHLVPTDPFHESCIEVAVEWRMYLLCVKALKPRKDADGKPTLLLEGESFKAIRK